MINSYRFLQSECSQLSMQSGSRIDGVESAKQKQSAQSAKHIGLRMP